MSTTTPAPTYVISVRIDPDTKKPVCKPHTVDVKGENALLMFLLETPGYVFRSADPIVVVEGGDQFPYPSWTPMASVAALFDLNTQSGDFRYKVHVKNVDTGEEFWVDPGIRNGT